MGLISAALGLEGSKPDIPAFQRVDTTAETRNAINANLTNLPSLQNLIGQANTFNAAEFSRLAEFALPGFQRISANLGANIEALSRGIVPDDVGRSVRSDANARAVSGGFAGSEFGRNLQLRDLGLTSLQAIQSGLNSASRWLAATRIPQVDVSSMFLTPAQQIAITQQDNVNQFNRDLMQAQIDALPSPGTQAVINALDAAEDDARAIGRAWASFAIGGMAAQSPVKSVGDGPSSTINGGTNVQGGASAGSFSSPGGGGFFGESLMGGSFA